MVQSNEVDTGPADSAKMAGACIKGLISSIPPEFCWKKKADAGTMPNCPEGYRKSGALCYESCRDDYKVVAGICWSECDGGWKDYGMTCTQKKYPYKTRGKKSYMPKSKTMFDGVCPSSKYRSGALCYFDCRPLGMSNCGIGGCARNAASCGTTITNMAVDTASGVLDAITFAMSFGASSAATAAKKAAVEKGMEEMG